MIYLFLCYLLVLLLLFGYRYTRESRFPLHTPTIRTTRPVSKVRDNLTFLAYSILLLLQTYFIHHNIACDSNVSFEQDVEDPMNACLFPEPIHVSLPMNPRVGVLARDKV